MSIFSSVARFASAKQIARIGALTFLSVFGLSQAQPLARNVQPQPGFASATKPATQKAAIPQPLLNQPLLFEHNAGQLTPEVRYLARSVGGVTYFFTENGVSLVLAKSERNKNERVNEMRVLQAHALKISFAGANPHPVIIAEEPSASVSNYFLGHETELWRANVANFHRIRYREIYPGIDLVYYGNGKQLEYDFIVQTGADPNVIRIQYEGATEALRLSEHGNIAIATSVGLMHEQKPFVYQQTQSGKHAVDAAWQLASEGELQFALGGYDRSQTLYIDPVLYSTFIGGSGKDECYDMALDGGGNVYVIGYTNSANYPTTAGAYNVGQNGASDILVTKLNASGAGLVYSTFIGGSGNDWGVGIAVDVNGNACLTGFTESSNYPTTAGAYDASFNGFRDIIVTKLNASGTALLFSTFIGGCCEDAPGALALDANGNVWLAAMTSSGNYPTTPGAFDNSHNGGNWDAAVAKLSADGATLLYSTYLGGNGNDEHGWAIAVDASANAYVVGYTNSTNFPTTAGAYDLTHNGGGDVFISKFNPTGSTLLYSTYLGGSGEEGFVDAIAIDASGSAYIAGQTSSSNYPITSGAFDASFNGGVYDLFATKINSSGSALVYSTFLGGSNDEDVNALAVDLSGNACFTGHSNSTNYPTSTDAFDQTHNGANDVIITQLNAAGSGVLYSSFIGGSGEEFGDGIALDGLGNVFIAGSTSSSNYPTTPGAYDESYNGGDQDIFVTKIQIAEPPEITNVKPLQNALAIYKTANVIVNFNTAMNATTLNNSTIRVHGSQSGLHPSSNITYGNNTKTLTFNPDASFEFGEVVTVTLTTGIVSASGAALLNPFTWSFTVDVADSEGDFVKASETATTLADRMAAGDFDADGDLDLAITNGEANTVSILKNGGNGNFIVSASLNLTYRPNSVSIGDFDSDGDLDLVVTVSISLGEVTIFKNDGSGNFTFSSSPTVGYRPSFASVGDYDGDGDLDLAVALNGSGSEANSGAAILLNDGSGAFTISSMIDAPGCEFPHASGDWDGDGDLDLAVPTHCSFGVSILQNNGDGGFTLTATVGAGNYPSMVAAGDLDGDGDLDLVVPNRNDASSSPSTVTILKNDGSGNFVNASSPSITGPNPQSLDLGDFDNDNDLDLVVVNGPLSSVSILLNDGLGTFTNSAQPSTGNSVNWVLTADFDKDGDLDLAATSGPANSVSILKKAQIPIYPVAAGPQTAGNEFWVQVKVGDNNNPVENLFGVSFVLHFTHTDYIDVATPVSGNVLAGAFMGNNVVFQQTVDEASGKVSIGVARKQGQPGVNGSGAVARVKFIVRSNLPSTGAPITFSLSEVNAVTPGGSPLILHPRTKQVTINNAEALTVWPGDTNNDGVVNQNDVLPIGQYWGLAGPARVNASSNWIGQACNSWTPTRGTYADAIGDGKIDQADVLPIGVNWGNTHAAVLALAQADLFEQEKITTSAMIQAEAPHALAPGQEFFIKVKVAEVNDLFGLAFELISDRPDRLQILSVSPEAFLGNDIVFISNIDTASGNAAVGMSRKAGQVGVNGNGAVVRVKARILPAAIHGETITVSLRNVAATDVNGAALALNAQPASLIITGTTAVEANDQGSVPTAFNLAQNYPNPFNPSTKISFALLKAGEVTLRIYNETGQLVRTLAKRAMSAGAHELDWNGLNQSGEQVVAGVYLYQILVTNDRGEVVFNETKRMTLLK